MMILLGAIVIMVGIGININLSEIINSKSSTIIITGGIYFVLGVGFFLYRYVEEDNSRKEPKKEDGSYNLSKEIKEMRNAILHFKINDQENRIDTEYIDTTIEKKIKNGFDNEFKNFISNEYKEKLSSDYKLNIIKEETKELQYGINNQIGKLSRSGTINLIIGLFLSIIAIAILISLLYSFKDSAYHDMSNFLTGFLPRLSLVIFIEIFSFFFLKLYKRSLDDIKYYQNERTNIDSKVIALKASIIYGKPELINTIIKGFSMVERNFIIKKGESTVSLEKLKIEDKEDSDILDRVLSIIKTIDAKKT
ncbi:MAG: hypothetical protein JWQ85_2353 [Mucilaginibacter sp.]|nr:hypothetical protein [Mucilaginibacter sp.]